jgi:dTDP-4-dehydrorhamnose 3,5-epimerase-like enzyme
MPSAAAITDALMAQANEHLVALCDESNELRPSEFELTRQAQVTMGLGAKEVEEKLGYSRADMAKGMHAHHIDDELVLIMDLPEAQMVVTIPRGSWRVKAEAAEGGAVQ